MTPGWKIHDGSQLLWTRYENGSAGAASLTLINMRRSLGDAACFGGMVGCGETYFAAFALAIGLGEATAGAVASIPLLVGGLAQLLSPIAIPRVGGMQRWIVIGATLQAFSLIPLAVAAWSQSLSSFGLILLVSVYWAGGMATGPAWNTWMDHVIPSAQRIRFFSRRSRLQQCCTFAGLLGAGVFLQWATAWRIVLPTFATLFFIAAALRILSATLLHRTHEDPALVGHRLSEPPEGERQVQVCPQSTGLQGHRTTTVQVRNVYESFADKGTVDAPLSRNAHEVSPSLTTTHLLAGPADRIAAGGFKLFLIYLIAMQLFVQVCGPYFAPYMLKHLQMGYGTFVGLIAAAFMAKIVSTIVWGHFAERWGSRWVLFAGGVGLIPLAWFWNVSDAIVWLTFAQIASGTAWAAYELGMLLMIFETVPAARRVRLLTWYNFASSLAIVSGAAIGAYWLKSGGFNVETYHQLFTLSSVGRLCCLVLVVPLVWPSAVSRSMKTLPFVSNVNRFRPQNRAA